jgi:hypothetical protein
VPVDFGTRQGLRHQVCWVLCPQHLVEPTSFATNEVLHPKLRNGKVSYLADAAAIADANCRATVRVDLGSKLDAEVPRDTLQA